MNLPSYVSRFSLVIKTSVLYLALFYASLKYEFSAYASLFILSEYRNYFIYYYHSILKIFIKALAFIFLLGGNSNIKQSFVLLCGLLIIPVFTCSGISIEYGLRYMCCVIIIPQKLRYIIQKNIES